MSSARAALQELARQAMRDRGFDPEPPPAAIDQLDHLQPSTQPARRDLRDRLWCSIDNDDSRDLDQLTVAESRGGETAVMVAIADVDILVPRGSPIDDHAAHNTTSVYTPARMFPMLPEELSTDRTSLAPHEDRAAIVIDYTVSAD